jgi:hypothetical protein
VDGIWVVFREIRLLLKREFLLMTVEGCSFIRMTQQTRDGAIMMRQSAIKGFKRPLFVHNIYMGVVNRP